MQIAAAESEPEAEAAIGYEYTCAFCKGTFESDRTNAEAMEEAEAIHGNLLGDDPAVVCDDCFRALMLVAPS